MPEDFEFGLTFRADERLDATAVAEALTHMESLLLEIESRLTDHAAIGHWKWADESTVTTLRVAITPNGLTSAVIENVLSDARQGFQAGQQGPDARFPESFGPAAIQSVRNILRRLESVESIVVEATGQPPLEITEAVLPGITRQRVRRVWSSVDGVLEVMSGKNGQSNASIREHGTNRLVKCFFPSEEWDSRIRAVWKRRVLIEGRVGYNAEGLATSVSDIVAMHERETVRLSEFRGFIPGLTQGRSPEEHIAKVRGDG